MKLTVPPRRGCCAATGPRAMRTTAAAATIAAATRRAFGIRMVVTPGVGRFRKDERADRTCRSARGQRAARSCNPLPLELTQWLERRIVLPLRQRLAAGEGAQLAQPKLPHRDYAHVAAAEMLRRPFVDQPAARLRDVVLQEEDV